jgi:putative spermidine/putrescine transport system permease protein
MVGSSSTIGFRFLVGALYFFLLAPILVVLPLSFASDTMIVFPPSGWSLRWYEAMFQHEGLMKAFRVSLMLAAVVTVVSLGAGLPAAYALKRYTFTGRDALTNLFTAPLLLPSIVLGLSILLVFVKLNLLGTFPGLVVAHLVITTPYVVRIMSTALSTLPPSVEEAATMLGAPPFKVFCRVTLPLMMPGLIASAALAFLLSFDEVVISLFITGPRISTLPVEIFNYVESKTDPLIAAVSVVLVAATLAVVLLVERSIGFSKAMVK